MDKPWFKDESVQDRREDHSFFRNEGFDQIIECLEDGGERTGIAHELNSVRDIELVPPVGAVVTDHSPVIGDLEKEDVRGNYWAIRPGSSLGLMDSIADREKTDLYYPSNLGDSLSKRYSEIRARNTMEAVESIAERLPVKGFADDIPEKYKDMRGDAMIAEAAENETRFHETAIVLTYDSDFLELENDYDIIACSPKKAEKILDYQDRLSWKDVPLSELY